MVVVLAASVCEAAEEVLLLVTRDIGKLQITIVEEGQISFCRYEPSYIWKGIGCPLGGNVGDGCLFKYEDPLDL